MKLLTLDEGNVRAKRDGVKAAEATNPKTIGPEEILHDIPLIVPNAPQLLIKAAGAVGQDEETPIPKPNYWFSSENHVSRRNGL